MLCTADTVSVVITPTGSCRTSWLDASVFTLDSTVFEGRDIQETAESFINGELFGPNHGAVGILVGTTLTITTPNVPSVPDSQVTLVATYTLVIHTGERALATSLKLSPISHFLSHVLCFSQCLTLPRYRMCADHKPSMQSLLTCCQQWKFQQLEQLSKSLMLCSAAASRWQPPVVGVGWQCPQTCC